MTLKPGFAILSASEESRLSSFHPVERQQTGKPYRLPSKKRSFYYVALAWRRLLFNPPKHPSQISSGPCPASVTLVPFLNFAPRSSPAVNDQQVASPR